MITNQSIIMDPFSCQINILPDNVKKDLEFTYELKQEFREVIDELKRSEVKRVDNYADVLKNLNKESILIESSQSWLLKSISSLRTESRCLSEETREHGIRGMRMIGKERNLSQPQILPIPLYDTTLDLIEKKAAQCIIDADDLSQLTNIRKDQHSSLTSIDDISYGHQNNSQRIQKIAQIIRQQNEALLRVAALVAEQHRQVDVVREAFRSIVLPATSGTSDLGESDPFLQADRKEQLGKNMKAPARSGFFLENSNPQTSVSQSQPFATVPQTQFNLQPQQQQSAAFQTQPTGSAQGFLGLAVTPASTSAPGNAFSSSSGFGFGSNQAVGNSSTLPPAQHSSSFLGGGGSAVTAQTSAAGDLVTPTRIPSFGASDRNHGKKKIGTGRLGSSKH